MTGTWEGDGFEEVWGPARAGTMLGTSRAIQGDKTVHTEFMLIADSGESCTLELYLPETGKSMVFKPAWQQLTEVQWVMNDERLTYRRQGDVLHIKLEKPGGGFELALKRVQ